MVVSYELLVDAVCGTSMAFNALLLSIVIKCPLKMLSTYKYFFMLDAIQGLLSSLCFLLSTPITVSQDFAFLLLSTSLVSQSETAQSLLTLYTVTFISSFVLVTNNFVYRYVQLCRPRYLYIYSSAGWIVIISCVNVCIISNWTAVIYVSCWPTEALIESIRTFVLHKYNVDPAVTGVIGLSMKLTTLPSFLLFVEGFLLVAVLGNIGTVCAWKINHCIKQNSMSPLTQKMHRRMFILLVVQIISPALFLHVPLVCIYVLLFTGVSSPWEMTYGIGFLMSFYPLSCPIIIVAFVKDYRNLILSLLRLRKPSVNPVSVAVYDGETPGPTHLSYVVSHSHTK